LTCGALLRLRLRRRAARMPDALELLDGLGEDQLERLELELEEKWRARAAGTSLAEFARLCGYEPAPHHLLLIAELEALEGNKRQGADILLVFMPPGAAKSTYVNFLFPAWCMLRRPDRNVLTASHSSELAERWGRKTRNLLAGLAGKLGVRLDPNTQAAHRWGMEAGGEYYAVGVGVGIAGFRADLGIIDDPFGSREDAESKKVRETRWGWYTDDFSSRLTPGARRVIMHTRWHDDDLAGRAIRQLEGLGRSFRLLNLPAEARDDDPLGRLPGEMLWDDPAGYDYGAFLRARKQESDPRTWASLYQQNPVPDEGAYFQAAWLKTVDLHPPVDDMRIFGASDYAVTDAGGDYTVHLVVGIDRDDRMYLLDLWRRQSDSAVWIDAWCDLVKRWKPVEWAEESGQIKASIGPFRDRRARERGAYVYCRAFPSRADKAVRAQSIRGRMALGGLYLPARVGREPNPWRSEFEAELLRFPVGVHDDQVDALSLIGQLLDNMHAPRSVSRPGIDNMTGYSRLDTRPKQVSLVTL
jgi:predicted phage terminase large subunit-like protein